MPYQSTHNTGGAIMGADPKTSALNKYLQSWDVPNVFVIGASAFPQNAGYNPTGTVGALAFHAADAIITKYLKSPGPLVQIMTRALSSHRVVQSRLPSRCSHPGSRAQWICSLSIVVERGKYLATAADCAACHTKPGGKPFAGGVAIETPFGTMIGPNITPDPDAGIGAWTDDEFVSALREGRGRNGIRLYPAMPYPAYTNMTREDALAIRAYLQTIDPAPDRIEPNHLSFPFDIRSSLIVWNAINFTTRCICARSVEIRAVESGALPCRCAWSLRHLSYAEDRDGCRRELGLSTGHDAARLVRA